MESLAIEFANSCINAAISDTVTILETANWLGKKWIMETLLEKFSNQSEAQKMQPPIFNKLKNGQLEVFETRRNQDGSITFISQLQHVYLMREFRI